MALLMRTQQIQPLLGSVITIQIEDPVGTVTANRAFDPGYVIPRVSGRATAMGIPMAFETVEVQLRDGFATQVYHVGTGIGGDWWVNNMELPNVTSDAEIIASIRGLFGIGSATASITIGIGKEPPAVPSPDGGFNWELLLVFAVFMVMMIMMQNLSGMFGGLFGEEKKAPQVIVVHEEGKEG